MGHIFLMLEPLGTVHHVENIIRIIIIRTASSIIRTVLNVFIGAAILSHLFPLDFYLQDFNF